MRTLARTREGGGSLEVTIPKEGVVEEKFRKVLVRGLLRAAASGRD